jgi:Mad3/BUB1 homology region 1
LCCSRFEAELAAYQGDDPLEPWLRYIHTMQDECPSDQSEQCSLLEVSMCNNDKLHVLQCVQYLMQSLLRMAALLQACARSLRGVERYRNDQRYLKVCVVLFTISPIYTET